MIDDRPPLSPDRAALVERAALWLADRPHSPTPIPDLVVEFELTISEACAALRRSEQMKTCRRAFG